MTEFLQELLELLEEIAQRMNREGSPVDPEAFQRGLAELPAVKAEQFLDGLHDDVLYAQWTASEPDLFWRCRGPSLMHLPYHAQKAFRGVRVDCVQSHLYMAARVGGAREWLDHYAAGGDLITLASQKLHMRRSETKAAVFRYLFGAVDIATTWQVEATFPWLADAVGRFERHALDGDAIHTDLGVKLGVSLFPRSSFGRYLTQTVKDIVRVGVLRLYSECDVVPILIVPDGAIVTSGANCLVETWTQYGLRVEVEQDR